MGVPGLGLRLLTILTLLIPAVPAWAQPLQVAVIAPQPDHLAWASARLLQNAAEAEGLHLDLEASASGPLRHPPDLVIMPVRSLAARVPALEVLELPFLYSDLEAVHQALDGVLGVRLRRAARAEGWEILAFWDEGMHVMSGLRRYDRAVNLTGMEFLITRPDPVAARQFLAWKATPRTIRPASRDAVLRECLIASRAATLQELQREGLQRVHMTVALTRHRYEGWLVLSPSERWSRLSDEQRAAMGKILPTVTRSQRAEAARRERAALAALRDAGMLVYDLNDDQRQAFEQRLPNPAALLSEGVAATARELLPPPAQGEDERVAPR